MDDAILDAEEERRKYCITHLRHGDMGEDATNRLMELLSDDPEILELEVSPRLKGNAERPKSDKPFEIKETNQASSVVLQTRIAALEISDIMAARLRSLFVTQNPPELVTPRYLSDFARSTFLLLYRYSYVDPGFRRQGYLGPRYFESISRAFGQPIDLEAFAAAFNTTVPRYCSLFPDVEGPFGSQGSFFDMTDLGENMLIQVSPPRIGPITTRAVNQCIKLLDGRKRFFVLLTPAAWFDVTRRIDGSGFCVWHNNIRRGDTIEYHDVVRNASARYPMPRVSVLSKHQISPSTSQGLHAIFSS